MGYFPIYFISTNSSTNIWLLMHNTVTLHNPRVYTTKTISTIVDPNWVINVLAGLYDQNNFYYCRLRSANEEVTRVYTTKTISTIVDTSACDALHRSLYDQNNFYYCRCIELNA